MSKNLTPVDPSQLDDLIGYNAETAQETAAKTLQPTISMLVLMTGLTMSEPDEKSGDRHGIFHLAPVDYAESIRAGKLVPVADEKAHFDAHTFNVKALGGKDSKGEALTAEKLNDYKARNAESYSKTVGFLFRALGENDAPAKGAGAELAKRVAAGVYPVGLWNPSTNKPAKKESYVDKTTNQPKTFEVKDAGDVSFAILTPAVAMERINEQNRALAKGGGVTPDALREAMARSLPDVRRYAKMVDGGGNRRGGSTGGGNAPGGAGGSLGGLGDAPDMD